MRKKSGTIICKGTHHMTSSRVSMHNISRPHNKENRLSSGGMMKSQYNARPLRRQEEAEKN